MAAPMIPTRLPKVIPVLLFLMSVATPAWCQFETGFTKGFAREGGYAGVSTMPDFTFDGVTFDGESGYKKVGGEEIVVLPRLDSQRLFRGILGYRGRQAAFEISYDRTQHDGTFMGEPMKATFQAVNVDGRFFFLSGTRVQPHVLVGGSFPWLNIKEGSFLEGEVGDARFKGYGVNTEAGVTVYPHPRVGVAVGYNYRVIWFDRATGVADELGELRPRFRETSGSVVITGMFTF
jgi:hypothetical protein